MGTDTWHNSRTLCFVWILRCDKTCELVSVPTARPCCTHIWGSCISDDVAQPGSAACSIAGGYMVRSLAATYSPAALACYLAVVLDPGRRVFKQSAGGCFEYVQEARAAPPTSESNLQIQEVTSGASCMVGPGNLGRKRPQPDADSSSSSTGHNAGEPCLDCSRLTCFRQYPG